MLIIERSLTTLSLVFFTAMAVEGYNAENGGDKQYYDSDYFEWETGPANGPMSGFINSIQRISSTCSLAEGELAACWRQIEPLSCPPDLRAYETKRFVEVLLLNPCENWMSFGVLILLIGVVMTLAIVLPFMALVNCIARRRARLEKRKYSGRVRDDRAFSVSQSAIEIEFQPLPPQPAAGSGFQIPDYHLRT